MSPDLRTYCALAAAEAGLRTGYTPSYAVRTAAADYGIDCGTVALLLMEKQAECAQARVRLAEMAQADSAIEHGLHSDEAKPGSRGNVGYHSRRRAA